MWKCLVKVVIICVLIISCNPKDVFFPLDTIVIENNVGVDLYCNIQLKNIARKFTFQKGFFYEENGIKYKHISKAGISEIKNNCELVLVQVERNNEIETLDLLNNVIENIYLYDNNNNIYLFFEYFYDYYMDTIETNVNNYVIHKIIFNYNNTD